jgi:hypothetical protein
MSKTSFACAVVLYALLGLTLGLGFWTNFLSLVYFPAVAVLLVRRGLRPLVAGLVAVAPAFLLGSLPHWLYGIPHRTAMPSPGRSVPLGTMLAIYVFRSHRVAAWRARATPASTRSC